MKSDDARKQRATSPGTFNPLVGLDSKSPEAAKARQIAEAANKGSKTAALGKEATRVINHRIANKLSAAEKRKIEDDKQQRAKAPKDFETQWKNDLREELAGSDKGGNKCAFDPWPLAALYAALNPNQALPFDQRAQALQRRHLKAEKRYTGPRTRSPTVQLDVAIKCLTLKQVIDGGKADDTRKGGAVLDAMMQCVAHGMVVPVWLAIAFIERARAPKLGFARRWADLSVFGPELPPRTDKRALQSDHAQARSYYISALKLMIADPGIRVGALYEEVAAREGGGNAVHVKKCLKRHEIRYTDFPTLDFARKYLNGRRTDAPADNNPDFTEVFDAIQLKWMETEVTDWPESDLSRFLE
jgi:hypothetical protein